MELQESTKVLPYVYKLTNHDTGEFYIGYRFGNSLPSSQDLGKEYFTSSKFVRPRFDEFEYRVLAEFFDDKDAFWFEQRLIEENWNDPNILNRKYQKQGTTIFRGPKGPLTDEHKRKVSLSMRGKKKSEEHINNVAAALKGKRLSEEHKQNLRKPKTISKAMKDSHESAKSRHSIYCSCINCKEIVYLNHLSRHNCKFLKGN